MTLIWFLIVLGVLVFVHELGHFVVAKLCGVYVECFSLGFGPRLLWLRIGETEYRISAIPLGGYVRMAGQSDLAEDVEQEAATRYAHVAPGRRFDRKPVVTRMAIILAGPIMNLLFAVPIVFLVLVTGEGRPLALDATVIGRIAPSSPAAQAGLRPGDRILAADGQAMTSWQQWQRYVRNHIGTPLQLTYLHRSATNTVELTPGINTELGYMGIGVEQMQRAQVLAIASNSPAAATSLRVGDVVDRLIGVRTTDLSFPDLLRELRARPEKKTKLGIKRFPAERYNDQSNEFETADVLVTLARVGSLQECDLLGNIVVRRDTTPTNFPLQTGDRIVAINDRPLAPADVSDAVRLLPAGDAAISCERLETMRWRIFKRRTLTNVSVRISDAGFLGVVFNAAEQRVKYHPRAALRQSLIDSYEMLVDTLTSLRIIVRERLGVRALAGPVTIARMTGEAAQGGMDVLLRFMLIITINLGILNLLPLPVLDGGHVVLLLIEGILRRPLPTKLVLWIWKIGLVLLLTLLSMVMFNDIVLWIEHKESLCVGLGTVLDHIMRW
jgi:regulator of sigma E protease